MVAWYWLIPAVMVGAFLGFTVAALLVAAGDGGMRGRSIERTDLLP
jgi:hypothetical protein